MMRSNVLCAATTAALIAGAVSAQATEVIYGFNSPTLGGFTKTYDQDGTATATESLTTGVTEGTGALHVAVAPTGGGYDQIDLATTAIPSDLIAPTTSSLSLDAAADYNNAEYVSVAPYFTIDGTTDGAAAFGAKLLLTAKTLPYDNGVPTDHTDAFTLTFIDPFATAHPANSIYGAPATPADGDSTTTKYTVGHIVAQILSAFGAANPSATIGVSSFGLEMTTNTQPDSDPTDPGFLPDLGSGLYVDNITLPLTATPEPASLALLAVGGFTLTRRRSR